MTWHIRISSLNHYHGTKRRNRPNTAGDPVERYASQQRAWVCKHTRLGVDLATTATSTGGGGETATAAAAAARARERARASSPQQLEWRFHRPGEMGGYLARARALAHVLRCAVPRRAPPRAAADAHAVCARLWELRWGGGGGGGGGGAASGGGAKGANKVTLMPEPLLRGLYVVQLAHWARHLPPGAIGAPRAPLDEQGNVVDDRGDGTTTADGGDDDGGARASKPAPPSARRARPPPPTPQLLLVSSADLFANQVTLGDAR